MTREEKIAYIMHVLPKIKGIYIGPECKQNPEHGYPANTASSYIWDAHTHCCPNDIDYHTICVKDENFLLNSDDTISVMVLHEYAHILTDYGISCRWDEKDASHIHTINKWDKRGHGEAWIENMKALGLTDKEYHSRYSPEPY